MRAVLPAAARRDRGAVRHIRRPLERLEEAALDLAEERGVWIGRGWTPREDPAVQRTALWIGDDALEVPPDEAAELYRELLDRAAR